MRGFSALSGDLLLLVVYESYDSLGLGAYRISGINKDEHKVKRT